ncbi:hypothetical protein V1477_019382 [Vespula maculifrons]|uniref:Uncharacterized protein n=1 Tax=Vespula maculifrons TaxID=7453 RepID=A0ABD2AT22_VESMC
MDSFSFGPSVVIKKIHVSHVQKHIRKTHMDTNLHVTKNCDSDAKNEGCYMISFQRIKRFDTIIVLKKRNRRVHGSDRKLQEHSCIVNIKHRFPTMLAKQFVRFKKINTKCSNNIGRNSAAYKESTSRTHRFVEVRARAKGELLVANDNPHSMTLRLMSDV